jgi:hypothetical protein
MRFNFIKGDHMTIRYPGGLMDGDPRIGTRVQLICRHFGCTSNSCAVRVDGIYDSTGSLINFVEPKKNPFHITLIHYGNRDAVDSDKIDNWSELPSDIILNGQIGEYTETGWKFN